MSASCQGRDEALLMLVHGEIGARQALRLRVHLALCPACRARRQSLEQVTRSLAIALSNPRLGTRRFARPPRIAWTSVGLLIALFAILGFLVSSEVSAARGATSGDSNVPAPSCHTSAAPRPPTAFPRCESEAPKAAASAPRSCHAA